MPERSAYAALLLIACTPHAAESHPTQTAPIASPVIASAAPPPSAVPSSSASPEPVASWIGKAPGDEIVHVDAAGQCSFFDYDPCPANAKCERPQKKIVTCPPHDTPLSLVTAHERVSVMIASGKPGGVMESLTLVRAKTTCAIVKQRAPRPMAREWESLDVPCELTAAAWRAIEASGARTWTAEFSGASQDFGSRELYVAWRTAPGAGLREHTVRWSSPLRDDKPFTVTAAQLAKFSAHGSLRMTIFNP